MLGLRGSLSLCVVSLLVCLFGLSAQAEYDAAAETSTYVFVADQSTVVQTGGIAGVHETYGIEGTFQLTVDSDAGIASFDRVDANLTEPTGFLYTQSLGVLFNMTELAGTVVDDTRIEFEGRTSDDTDTSVQITLTFANDSVHLTGETIPPPGSADFFIFNLDAVARKKYAGGSGTADDPYQIATAADLIALDDTPEDYDKHFVLKDDIDLDPNLPGRKVFDRALIVPDATYEEFIQGRVFNGSFNGHGHRIKNLTICSAAQVMLGLFGVTGRQAKLLNLTLDNVSIKGVYGVVGALSALNQGLVTHCYANGTISCTSRSGALGGLVGDNRGGSIVHCCADCEVYGEQAGCMGALVGHNWFSGRISNCCASGRVTGYDMLGGLVGASDDGDISNCYATGSVSGSFLWIGGLVGSSGRSTISNCYATGGVSGKGYVGGLVGDSQYGTITNCYSVGGVSGPNNVGGLVGVSYDGVFASFWDIETSRQTTSHGGTGKTTTEMQTISTFLEAGWDFVGESENGMEDVWAICEGQDYPRLTWQFVVGDFDGDTHTDFADFCIFAERWLQTDSSFWCGGGGTDFNNDSNIDFADLKELANNWLAAN